MRVVFLTHNYPRAPQDLAGAFLHPLAAALVRRGIAVTVLAPSDRGQDGGETRDGVVIERVRYAAPHRERLAYGGRMLAAVRTPGGWLALAGLLRALRRRAREVAAEARAGGDARVVVHAHWWIPAGLAAPPELPQVLTLHGTDARLLQRIPPARWLGTRVIRRAQAVTVVSQDLAHLVTSLTGRRIPDAHVLPMPATVPPSEPNAPHATPAEDRILTVARLTAQKRVHLLLEAAARLHTAGRRFTLAIAGDGPERSRLETLSRNLGLGDRVRFHGAIPPAEVWHHLAEADLFVLPAAGEGFGVAALEALLAGVPILVCRDGGGLLDLLAPPVSGAGRSVAPEAAALAGAMAEMLDDPALAAAARTAAGALRAQVTPDAVAARYAAVYAEALHA